MGFRGGIIVDLKGVICGILPHPERRDIDFNKPLFINTYEI